MSYDPYEPPNSPFAPPSSKAGSKVPGAGLPLGLGIFGLIAWILPIVGVPVVVWGLIRGIKAMAGPGRAMAIVAVSLCSIGLALGVLNMAFGVYLAVTGQNPLVNQMKGQ